MINSSNISEYIQFLYLQKYKTEAPQEVLNSWGNIPNESINGYLQELYQHWGLSNLEAQNYERKFSNPIGDRTINDTIQQPITTASRPKYEYQETTTKSKSPWKMIITVLIFALLSVIAYLAYNLMCQPPKEVVQPIQTAPAVTHPVHSEPSAPVAAPVQDEATSQADYEKTMTIKQLFTAEENRDINGILSTFSPYMERYWDITYPTEEELVTAYQHTWDITKDNKHSNVQIKKVDDSTFDVSTTYTYLSLKNQKNVTIMSKLRLVFDKDNKIVKTYGLK